MKATASTRLAEIPPDVVIPGACLCCDGDLEVRITAGGARGYCGLCRSISRPIVWRLNGALHLVHTAGGAA
jgi:hypothetical protein